jgi:serine/threonine protein kinase
VSSESPKSESVPASPNSVTQPGTPPVTQFGVYRAGRLLGEGGMGSVYEATHTELNRRAAVKVLHPRFARNRKLVARFLNEARAVNIISHPTLVNIYEFGQLDDGTAYFIMEFIEGETLHQALRKLHGLPMEPLRSMQILRQIASGMAAAHAKVIVHRDLKPTNIMLVKDADLRGGERVKLLDFGIAKIVEMDVEQEQSALTATDSLLGTPTYMSPEQCRNPRDVTDRTDVYSLGVIAYEMLTGHQPFRAASEIDTIMRHKQLVPPPASDLNPSIPPALDALVASMLAKSPMERPEAAVIKQKLTQILQMSALSGEHAPLIPGSLVAPVPSGLISSGSHRAVAGGQSAEPPAVGGAGYGAANVYGSGSAVPALSPAEVDAVLPTAPQVEANTAPAAAVVQSSGRRAGAEAQTLVAEGDVGVVPVELALRLAEARTAVLQPLPKDPVEPAKPIASAGLLDAPTAPPIARERIHPPTAMVPKAQPPARAMGSGSGSSSGSRAVRSGGDKLVWVIFALLIVAATFGGLYVLFGQR